MLSLWLSLALGCSTLLLQFRQDSLHLYLFPNIPISS